MELNNTEQIQNADYKKVSSYVEAWLKLHKGETFDLDTICRQLEAKTRTGRQQVAIKLWHLVKEKILEKSNKYYRYIDNTIEYIDWLNASEGKTIDLTFPYDHETDEDFDFAKYVTISPGDIIVIAGGSNFGKTDFVLNILWNNMDKYPCTLMGNEYTPAKFKRRVAHMTWANPLKEDGTPKFELIKRFDGWKDVIRPDNINIIDWINLSGDGDQSFYVIGKIIEGIQSKLQEGIAVIVLQKEGNKALGLGGQFSQHLSSLYLTIDYERLTVVKAKEWHDKNPNGDVYGFTIVNAGTQFSNIRKLKKCPKCFARIGGCGECEHKGWVNA